MREEILQYLSLRKAHLELKCLGLATAPVEESARKNILNVSIQKLKDQ